MSTTIDSRISEFAETKPNAVAVVHGNRSLTYYELNALIDSFREQLWQAGLRRSDVVAVALGDTIEHIATLLAISRACLIGLPIHVRWTIEEQRRVASSFGAQCAIVESAVQTIHPRSIVLSSTNNSGSNSDRSYPSPTPSDIVLQALSSGTTGNPKGPLLTHVNLIQRFQIFQNNLNLGPNDKFICCTPLYFGGGRSFSLAMLFFGGTVVLFPPPYSPEQLCAEIAQRDVSAGFVVPTLLRRLLTLDNDLLSPLRNMSVLVSSGSHLYAVERAQILERISSTFISYYSSTEGGGCTYLPPDAPPEYAESVGRAVWGVEVECVDDEHQLVEPGAVGAIRYRGLSVAGIGLQTEEPSSGAEDWFYPGDRGYLDCNGYLFLKGRSDNVIIRGGINIYPSDVEQVLLSHHQISDCAVIGWPSHEFDEIVVAFVVSTTPMSKVDVEAHCRYHLAAYKCPSEVIFLDELPRSPSGKVLEAELRAHCALPGVF